MDDKHIGKKPDIINSKEKMVRYNKKTYVMGAAGIILFAAAIVLSVIGNNNKMEDYKPAGQLCKENISTMNDTTDNHTQTCLYDKIKTGMTYEQVVNVMGNEGEEIGRTKDAIGFQIIYHWSDPNGRVISVIFLNNKVWGKK